MRRGRWVGPMNVVRCVLCGAEQVLKNMNQEAAAREAVRKGWICAPGIGWACPDCPKEKEES